MDDDNDADARLDAYMAKMHPHVPGISLRQLQDDNERLDAYVKKLQVRIGELETTIASYRTAVTDAHGVINAARLAIKSPGALEMQALRDAIAAWEKST